MANELIPNRHLEEAASRFKILSETVRLELLNQLQLNGEMTVSELVEATGHRQANVSKHLGMMAREGLLSRRKDGLYVHYQINDPTLSALCLLVCGRIREEELDEQPS
ncbi:transcriptional regulator [Longimonas halophila]|uniref:Transcriptional regulator n=1 Tax=Longimonas halophila TaxID=1469170 RepID=A0A2H3NKI2_9BACT|nr:metalloregulator ArsR/SmtB family transcription factor [Longimonas halophila]PEN06301.1 transcriptional regulator [Longimonas halophila]